MSTTSDNTSMSQASTTQHEPVQRNTSTTRDNTSKTQENTSMIRYNTSMTRLNMSTKEAQAANIGLYFIFLVIELYIFLISFRNC